jgi:hypothetical protein
MLYTGGIVGGGSGSVGGITFSHNRYGTYIRRRAVPVNPRTPQQEAVRAAMTALVQNWHTTLSQTERDGWENYAQQTPVLSKAGLPIILTGQSMYVRSGVARLALLGVFPSNAAPTVFDLGTFTPPTFSASAATGVLTVAFTDTDSWALEAGGHLLIFSGRAVNLGRNFYNGPWRFTDSVDGATPTAPTSPAAVGTYPFGTLVAGSRLKLRATSLRADGRYSTDFIDFCTVGA